MQVVVLVLIDLAWVTTLVDGLERGADQSLEAGERAVRSGPYLLARGKQVVQVTEDDLLDYRFLGFEVVRPSNISLWCRLGGAHIYVVVLVQPGRKAEMTFLNHNGIDVETEEEVDECHRLVVRDAEIWKLHKISKPMVQHGTYSFYFWDADDNSWEILANPPGGYSWMFERGDQVGTGHMSRRFERPTSTLRKLPKTPKGEEK